MEVHIHLERCPSNLVAGVILGRTRAGGGCYDRRMRSGTAFLLMLAAAIASGAACAEPLKPAVEKAVRAATFEVVVPKIPEAEDIEYERALPWDQVPYSIRNDPYISIGTAFAIGRNEFVTAAHVFALMMGSLHEQPRLRSVGGGVHEIDRILKFSGHQDFVVFTLREPPSVRPLATATRAELNSEVHAVGNALGDGIVIRSGLLTSETPEQQDGRWHWYRFSAAASPGNSGGPLVDGEGRVVGVIVAASPAENLNFALPIHHVLEDPGRVALLDTRGNYQLPIMPFSLSDTLRIEIPLPQGLPELGARLLDAMNRHGDALRLRYRSELKDRLFPDSPAAARMLLRDYEARNPRLIRYGDNQEWGAESFSVDTEAALPHGGEVLAGAMAGAALVRVRRPENQPLAALMTDSKLQMDLALKAVGWSRPIGNEMVRILSLGPADQDRPYEDSYGRRWQLRSWRIEPMDLQAIALLMPVPDGLVALMRLSPTGRAHANTQELKFLADFVYLTYGGTLPQWREFMQLGALRARPFERMAVEYVPGRQLSFRSPRFDFSLDLNLADISDRSAFELRFSYVPGPEGASWEVIGCEFREDVQHALAISAHRQPRIPPEIGGNLRRDWQRMFKRAAPFDGRPYNDDGVMRLVRVRGAAADAPEPAFLYELALELQSYPGEEELRRMLDQIGAGFRLHEKP
jgi:hypothetical protein